MKGASRYCTHCKQSTPVMFEEGTQYCMYCQNEYKEEEEHEKEDES